MPASTNLFEARASWPISPMEAPTAIKMEKAEEKTPPRVAAIPHAMINKPPKTRQKKSVDGDCAAPSVQKPLLIKR